MTDKKPIIIKKVKKGGHGGHHGGAWKIAYADFVTAMMAFFLLMWLLGNTPEETKKQLAIYFQEFSLIDGPPKSITLGVGGKDSSDPDKLKPIVMEGTIGMFAEGKSEEEKMKEAMAKMIEERLEQFKGGCKIFCVNGHLSRYSTAWRQHDRTQATSSRPDRRPPGGLQEA